jgi:5-formyltetrahydrofolate cyclo-ligase
MYKKSLRAHFKALYLQHDLSVYVADALQQVEQNEVFASATSVLVYDPIPKLEIPFMKELLHRNPDKKYYVPEVVSETEMFFVSTGGSVYRLSKNTCVIVPALALDSHGNRLGKGGGYYDRFLAEHASLIPKTLSVVPDFACLSDGYEAEAHDVQIVSPLFARETSSVL